jgi:hypothetical protein
MYPVCTLSPPLVSLKIRYGVKTPQNPVSFRSLARLRQSVHQNLWQLSTLEKETPEQLPTGQVVATLQELLNRRSASRLSRRENIPVYPVEDAWRIADRLGADKFLEGRPRWLSNHPGSLNRAALRTVGA